MPSSYSRLNRRRDVPDDPSCRVLSERAKVVALCSQKQAEDKLLIGAFIDFVRSENPRILSALEAIAVTGKGRGRAKTRNDERRFGRLYRQLRSCDSTLGRKPGRSNGNALKHSPEQ